MRKIFYYQVSLLLTLLSLMSLNASAQETGSPSFEAYDKIPFETELFTPVDSLNARATAKRDSIIERMPLKRNVYKPAPVVPKEKNSDEANDNSVLSFNFLYYLIQKYKMQDIVD